MLEFDDIQHILLTRAPALTGRYEFLSFLNAAGGRAWLSAILEKVHSAKAMREAVNEDKRWVSVAFTWNGLRALGVDETSLATFPEEFKQGMVARAEILGDSGANHPKNWVDNTASPDLHAIVILFAKDPTERGRCQSEHKKLIAHCEGVEVLSSLDLEAVPPLAYPHDHFGYRDRLSELAIEGSGDEPRPGFGGSVKAGEFILGYPDEEGSIPPLPRPEVLSRNGSYMAYRRRMIRRGAPYGPQLPEGTPEDGKERGIAAFVICASLVRQFEFAQNVWINDKNFHELGNERDPIIGNQDGTLEYKIPMRPIRKKITGLPAFTTLRGGAYFFLPGLKALRYLASLGTPR